MPRREEKFSVNASLDDLWTFIRDFESLCSCIPGVERINLVDDRTVELTVKEKIGVVPLIVDLTAQIEIEDPPNRLHSVATAEHLTMELDVALQQTGAGTEITAQFEVAGEGPLKPIVDRLFERRATERAAQFADILEQRFGAASSRDAPAGGRRPPVPARDRAGTMRQWLYRLWQRLSGPSTPPGNQPG
jgi:carbon monoxide dehydrogenase subunit G